jgi:hypothetical protein
LPGPGDLPIPADFDHTTDSASANPSPNRVLRLAPRKQRRGLVETAHWAFGAGGGAVFGALPRTVRRRSWAGPV